MTATKDRLAQALREADIEFMAARAADAYYDEFTGPLDSPIVQLATDLSRVGTLAALQLRQRVMRGEFDATVDEADAWAASPDGQETFAMFRRHGGGDD